MYHKTVAAELRQLFGDDEVAIAAAAELVRIATERGRLDVINTCRLAMHFIRLNPRRTT